MGLVNPLRWLRIAFFLTVAAVLALALWPLPAPVPLQTGWDKADHVLAFFALGVLGLSAWPQVRWRMAIMLLTYGGLIEVLQGLTAYRQADWRDFAADAIGVGLARLAVQVLARRRLRA